VSASDALFLAGFKGLVAGLVNCSLALLLVAGLPDALVFGQTLTLGFLGYGVSLVFFVLALRGLGSARTGAYFSTAPFLGADIAILFLGEPVSGAFRAAAVLISIGVWLHITERHGHEHQHQHLPMTHAHRHVHDEHHQHEQAFEWRGKGAHSHVHGHAQVRHSHPHFPDIHHRHTH
jgi:hypothetical protein